MQNELLKLVTIAVVIAPITGGIVQGLKGATGLNSKWNIVAAVVIGIALAGTWSLAFNHTSELGPYLLAGLLSGLSASGLYDLTASKNKGETK